MLLGKIDQESCFFTLFKLVIINHVINLFYEMWFECFKNTSRNPKIKILE